LGYDIFGAMRPGPITVSDRDALTTIECIPIHRLTVNGSGMPLRALHCLAW